MKMSDIEELIQAAANKDYAAATDRFNSLMSDKISDAFEQEKISLANNIFNGLDEEEVDELEQDEDIETEEDEEEFYEDEEDIYLDDDDDEES